MCGLIRSGRGLKFASLLCSMLLLAAACVAAPSGPVAGTASSPLSPTAAATQAPTPMPAATAAGSLALAAKATPSPHPTYTSMPSGEVPPSPAPALAPRTVTAEPAAASYSLTTRTGIGQVDRVIEAMNSGDRSSLRSLIRFEMVPCSNQQGLGAPPRCPVGQPEGTPLEVFPVSRVEGGFDTRADVDRLLQTPAAGLYAVYRVPTGPSNDPYWPAGEYGVMFLYRDGSPLTLLVTADGIVRINLPTGMSAAATLRDAGGTVVLPPRAQ